MSAPERPVFNDRYEIHSRIGRGGMADVFLARDRLLDRPVAVKVLFPEYATDPNFVERFRREAQAAANLNHPNIVGVYDWGRQSGTYFIVMEYVNGRTLADLLKSEGPMPAQRATDIAFDVAGALGFAHRNGVVHRDVKPGNILVAPSGAVKVADFGIARALNSAVESDLTQAGAVMGTATYFSPEQAQGANPDPRSDLYSLGIVMYEMASGRPPFSGENPVAIAYRQVHDTPQPLSSVRQDTPKGYEAITMKLLAKSPVNRYASAEDLRVDLKRFREGQQPAALMPTTGTELTTVNPAARAGHAAGAGAAASVAPTAVVPRAPAAPVPVPQATRVQPAQVIPPRGPMPPMYDDIDAAYGRRPRRAGWVIPFVVLAIAGLAVGGYALFKSLNKKEQAPPLLTQVPSVIDQDLVQAKALLEGLKFKVAPLPEAKSGIPVNVVWDQEPKPTAQAAEGSTVTLRYNPAPSNVSVPKVVGLTQEQAQAALATAGLQAAVTPQESETVVAGQVISQDPVEKTEIPPGGKVTIVVSSGKPKVEITNLFNDDATHAAQVLNAKGLQTTLEQQESDTVPAGKVIGTDPPLGAQVDKGSVVKIIVSSGAAPIEVPLVENLTERQARDKLQEAGFQQAVDTAEVVYGSPQDGKVISQKPAAGEKVPKGSRVTLTVGKALPPPPTNPPTTPPTVPKATTTSQQTTTTTTPK